LCAGGDFESAKSFVDWHGANEPLFHIKRGLQVYPLHVAVQYPVPELVQYLLEQGANPNAKDAKGDAVIDWAIRHYPGHDAAERNITLANIDLLVKAGVQWC
jgi:ankyrin repeat protein